MASQPHPDAIADKVLNTFNALPAKFKPRQLGDVRREWVPLAGIVLSRGEIPNLSHQSKPCKANNLPEKDQDESSSLTCVALATGMKCLPREKIPLVQGNVLHDWHAEILCLRAFNRWILDECHSLIATGSSDWLQCTNNERGKPPFALHPSIQIHMYISAAPCGDASMELTMASQSDATPWTSQDEGMLGRGNFDQLGVVRRKPARADAPVCWSKSCSDKLSMKQCTGLLSGVVSLLVEKCFLQTLVLPERECVPEAVERAFERTGRMKGMEFRAFDVKATSREFAFAKSSAGEEMVSSNLSAMWTPMRREVLINGVLQGRKQMDPKGASCVCRRRMSENVLEVAAKPGCEEVMALLGKDSTYAQIKGSQMLEEREKSKTHARETGLKGWMRNEGDEDWRLDSIGS